jgi:serine/threonine protein kinase
MEYADGGTLRNYLTNNFNRLTWNCKYNLAYQLACSVSCLHDEGIIHRDLEILPFRKTKLIFCNVHYIVLAFL